MAMSGIIEKKMDYRNRTTIKFEVRDNLNFFAAVDYFTSLCGQSIVSASFNVTP